MSFALRCHAESSHPRFAGEKCGGFVGAFPDTARFVRLIPHSDHKQSNNLAIPCSRCKKLHEVELRASALASSTAMAVA